MAAWTTDKAFEYNYNLLPSAVDSMQTHRMTMNSNAWANVYFKRLSSTEIEIGNFRHPFDTANIITPGFVNCKYKKVE